jgi:alanyl-tRNA synthetase
MYHLIFILLGTADTSAKILAIFHGRQFVPSVTDQVKRNFGLLLDKTNFYAESGGQETDIGSITVGNDSTEFAVEDVQVYGGYVLHVGYLKYGQLSVGDQAVCSYDEVTMNIIYPIIN